MAKKQQTPPSVIRFHAVIVKDHGAAEHRTYGEMEDMVADLRKSFREFSQIFVFQGGNRIPTTKAPVHLRAGTELLPLYMTPVEPEDDDAGFIAAAVAEEFEKAPVKPIEAQPQPTVAAAAADPFGVFDAFEDEEDDGFDDD